MERHECVMQPLIISDTDQPWNIGTVLSWNVDF